MTKFEVKLLETSLKAQIQAVKSSEMMLQTIIYQIRRLETLVRELNLALAAPID